MKTKEAFNKLFADAVKTNRKGRTKLHPESNTKLEVYFPTVTHKQELIDWCEEMTELVQKEGIKDQYGKPLVIKPGMFLKVAGAALQMLKKPLLLEFFEKDYSQIAIEKYGA